MKTNYKRVIEFSKVSGEYLEKFPKETKLKYAIEQVREKCQPVFDAYNKSIAEINLKHAKEDADGCVLFTETAEGRKYRFGKEGLIAKDKEVEELFLNEEKAEIEPYIATSLPKDLHESWVVFFKGFVIE